MDVLLYRLLLSVDRRKSIDDAKETVELAEMYMKNPGDHKAKVVGIDLSGDPSVSGQSFKSFNVETAMNYGAVNIFVHAICKH